MDSSRSGPVGVQLATAIWSVAVARTRHSFPKLITSASSERAKDSDNIQRFVDDFKPAVAELEAKHAEDSEAEALVERFKKILEDAYQAMDDKEQAEKEEGERHHLLCLHLFAH